MKNIIGKFVLILAMVLVSVGIAFAQVQPDPAQPTDIWALIANTLQPILVFVAVWLFKNKIAPNISGIVIVSLIVPLASGALALITYLIAIPGTSFTLQFVLGLLSNFISQLVIQMKKPETGTS